MSTRNVMLTEHYDRFVDDQVASGRFQDASEVFRAGLKLLEDSEKERELKLKMLSQAIEIGVKDLDEGRSFDFEDHEDLRAHLDAKLAKVG